MASVQALSVGGIADSNGRKSILQNSYLLVGAVGGEGTGIRGYGVGGGPGDDLTTRGPLVAAAKVDRLLAPGEGEAGSRHYRKQHSHSAVCNI
jgi:hypothetical protein